MLQLSKTEDYSVLLLNMLAANYEKRLVPLSEVAEKYHIPILFLRNITNKLRLAGFISAVEGKKGGYKLARDPKKILLGDILRVFTSKPLMAQCVDEDHPCTCGMGATVCQTGSRLRRMNQEFMEKVAGISLGDFVYESEKKTIETALTELLL